MPGSKPEEEGVGYDQLASEADRLRTLVEQLTLRVVDPNRIKPHAPIRLTLPYRASIPPVGRIRPAVAVEALVTLLNRAVAPDNNRPVVALPLRWRQRHPMSAEGVVITVVVEPMAEEVSAPLPISMESKRLSYLAKSMRKN